MTSRWFNHVPVLSEDVIEILGSVPAGVVLDATVGGGGHAAALLDSAPHLRVVGLDQDPAAVVAARERLDHFGGRATVVRSRFDRLAEVLGREGVDTLSGFLFDLGVSSHQLDEGGRGFSYRHEGPLDMRMDPDGGLSADDIVNGWAAPEIATVLADFGDERFAKRIAAAVVAARPIRTTSELAEIVTQAIPAATRRRGGHPAKRTFQALRIAVNSELSILAAALDGAVELLGPGGRGVVLSYHSGEDRIVKGVFARRVADTTPPQLPIAPAPPPFSLVRPISRTPSMVEQRSNPRARSARLRAIERTAA